jgi:hypothetical protein
MGERWEQNEDGSYRLIINRKNRKPLAIGHQERYNGCGYYNEKPKRKRTRQAAFQSHLKEYENE